MDFLNSLSPYIGVVIGSLLGWLTTFLNEVINSKKERKKRKSQIKYELIATYHSYWQTIRATVSNQNTVNFVSQRFILYRVYNIDSETVAINKKTLDDTFGELNRLFDLSLKFEGQLCGLQYEILDLYKRKMNSKKFLDLMNSVIEKGNNRKSNKIQDYTNVKTLEQLNEIQANIVERIHKKEREMFEEGEEVKKILNELLK